MSSQEFVSLHQQLHKCFEVLKVNGDVWEAAVAECSSLFSSLGNLAVQLKALRSVRPADTPLARFPALEQRLQHKLSQAVDAVLRQLTEKMDALQTVRNTVSQHVSAVFQFYEKHAGALDIMCCVRRSAVCPSIADMLEWLQDADRHYRLQLMQRRNLLQMLTPADLMMMETADVLCQVSFCKHTSDE